MNIGDRLKVWRELNKLTQKEVSIKFDVYLRTYQNFELGKSDPSAKLLNQLINEGLNLNWLFTGDGEMTINDRDINIIAEPKESYSLIDMDTDENYQHIPFYAVEASAGNGVVVDEEPVICHLSFRQDWLYKRGIQANKCALLTAKGDSMAPTISNGDLILIDTAIDTIQDDAIYVIYFDYHLMVKRIQKQPHGRISIISDNPKYDKFLITPKESPDLRIAGMVRWHGREI